MCKPGPLTQFVSTTSTTTTTAMRMGLKLAPLFCCLVLVASRTITLEQTALSMIGDFKDGDNHEHMLNEDAVLSEDAELSENAMLSEDSMWTEDAMLTEDAQEPLQFEDEDTDREPVEEIPSAKHDVAFYAYLSHSVSFTKYNTLEFDKVVYNAGNGYNQHTGVFTVPKAGTYIFSFHFENWRGNVDQRANLYVDGDIMAGSIIDPKHRSIQAGTTVTLYLKKGQSVYVKVQRGLVYGSPAERYTVFTGARL